MSQQQRYVFSVAEFCKAHDISRASFYNLAAVGRAPATMKVGRRRLITVEAAQEWRAKLTSENASG